MTDEEERLLVEQVASAYRRRRAHTKSCATTPRGTISPKPLASARMHAARAAYARGRGRSDGLSAAARASSRASG